MDVVVVVMGVCCGGGGGDGCCGGIDGVFYCWSESLLLEIVFVVEIAIVVGMTSQRFFSKHVTQTSLTLSDNRLTTVTRRK